MMLLIDIGNTRIKWAQLANAELGPQSAAPHAAWDHETFTAAILSAHTRPERVLVSNVGGERMRELSRAAIQQAWGIEPEFVRSVRFAAGVRNGYADVAKLGVDRWLAVIGAHAMERGALCVASVGTAMTIDGVDAGGQHLGGLIVPGPDLMIASLLTNTSDIAQRAQQGDTRDVLFADNTLGAIRQGAQHALAALIERAVATMKQDLHATPTLLLTGGACDRLDGALTLPHRIVPDLVLRGLAAVAAER